jgi:hypothetical protein
LEWLEGHGCINDDRRCIVANAEEASNLVRGTKEGAAKVLGVVEVDDLLLVVCRALPHAGRGELTKKD